MMAYITFYKGMTVSADDFDNNFKHIAQGHMLPRGGTSLEATTGVYDLGSDTYKWNKVHVQNVHVSGEFTKQMNLIAETTLTTTASAIEFTGLNGETDEIYEIICNVKGYATGVSNFYFNGKSNTADYGYQQMYADGAAYAAERQATSNGFALNLAGYGTTTAMYGKSSYLLYAKNDFKLCLSTVGRNIGDTYIRTLLKYGNIWNDSDTLTSIKFLGYFDPGTNIQIWAKR